MKAVTGESIDAAWAAAVDQLLGAPRHRISNLLVTIERPQLQDFEVENLIDVTLALDRPHRMSDVARTIIPRSIAESRDWLKRTSRILPHIRPRFYFERMVAYPTQGSPVNQLQVVIEGFNKRNRNNERLVDPGPIVFISTENGPTQQRGFPCLSEIQFHRDSHHLITTAVYRSQYYDTKAYGNFMGISRLALLVARETGLKVGAVSVLATQARLERVTPIRSVLKGMSYTVSNPKEKS